MKRTAVYVALWALSAPAFAACDITPQQIYSAIFPAVVQRDANPTVQCLGPNDYADTHSSVSGYAVSDAAATTNGNAVSLLGIGLTRSDGARWWGINTLGQDCATREQCAAQERMLIGAELDFNVMSSGTRVTGVSVGGNSLAQTDRGLANAYLVNTLGNGNRWTTGYNVQAGTILPGGAALSIGAQDTIGANVPSQEIHLGYRDSTSQDQVAVIQMTSGYLSVQTTAPMQGLALGSGDVWLSSGQCLRINGVCVISGTPQTIPALASNASTAQAVAAYNALVVALKKSGVIK